MFSVDYAPHSTNKDTELVSINLLKVIAVIGIIISHLDWENVNTIKILYSYWVSPAFTFLITIFAFQFARDFSGRSLWDWYSPDYFWKLVGRFIPAYVLLVISQMVIHSMILDQSLRTGFYTILTEGAFGPNGYYLLILLQLFCVFPFYLYLARYYPMLGFTVLVIFSVMYPLWPMDKLTPLLYNNLFLRFSIELFLGSALFFYWNSIKKTALPIFALVFGFFYFVLYDLGFDFQLFNRAKDLEGSLYPGLYAFGLLFYFLANEEKLTKLNPIIQRVIFTLGRSTYHILLIQLFLFSFINAPLQVTLIKLFHIDPTPRIRIAIEFLSVMAICISGGILFYYLQTFISRKFSSAHQSRAIYSKESIDGK